MITSKKAMELVVITTIKDMELEVITRIKDMELVVIIQSIKAIELAIILELLGSEGTPPT